MLDRLCQVCHTVADVTSTPTEHSMSDDNMPQQHEYTTYDADSISWWSWRPGIRPRNAVLLGGLITLLALLLGSIGLVTLVLGIMDSASAPLQLAGIVASHTTNNLDGFPRLSIRLHAVGFPASISPVVSKVAFHAIHDGDSVLVDYSPRLRFLYALDSAGRRYMLPGKSMGDNPIGALALLLLGVVLFPYPALLMLWGGRDLRSDYGRRDGYCTMMARVVGKRAAVHTTTQNRPGLTPQLSRSWYGVALDPVEPISSEQVMTFSIDDETYRSVGEGMLVQIMYSPNLHYVYKLEPAQAR